MTNSNDYLEIWNHYGQEHQLRKLMEETYEVTDAVRSGNLASIEEELADLNVVIRQITTAFNIDSEAIEGWVEFKVSRTLDRMKEEQCL